MPQRANPKTRRAGGQRLNLFLALVAAIAGYVTWVMFLSPFLVAYEVEGIQRVTCTNYMREKAYVGSKMTWEKTWQRRVRAAGVKQLDEDQYEFEISDPCSLKKGCSCDGEVVFEVITKWPFLGKHIEALTPRKTVHRKKVHTDYRVSY